MSQGDLDDHRARIESFAAELIDPYLTRVAASGRRHAPPTKEFNDPVWGTVQVRAEEVFILDSPLLQRLRRIRQLGVVHYVYPAATHTRMEHSLGTLHQMQRLIKTLNDSGPIRVADGASPGPPTPVVTGNLERALRIAALCHDVGHGAMSHVSEYALSDVRSCSDLQLEFQRAVKSSDNKQLSEIAAFYLIGSPAFGRLADAAAKFAGLAPIDGVGVLIQNLVAGRKIDDEHILIHELISGPFDADKLDYVARDATMCGVPIVTDVHRLIQKVRSIHVDVKGLPAGLRRRVQASNDGYLLTGVARSGGRSLDELALARALMFDKVYRHQKVRAIESMVFGLIGELVTICPTHPAELILRLTDDDLVALDRSRIADLTGETEPTTEEARQSVAVIEDLARRLRERDLFVRGFAFSSVMTGDTYRADPRHESGLKRFMSDCNKAGNRAEFIRRVDLYVRQIALHTGHLAALDVPGGNLAPYVVLSPPKGAPKSGNVDTGHAHLIDTDGQITLVQDDAGETMPWADAYITTRDLGHIFCPEPLAPFVFIAAETVLREQYAVHIPTSMLMYAKQSSARIVELKSTLVDAGWYDNKPADLRPLSSMLTRADADDRIEAVVKQLAGYSGPTQFKPVGTTDVPTSTIQKEQVVAFVQQFGDDELIDAALTMLTEIRVIGRDRMNAALEEFLRIHPEFEGANCAPLGESKDSSAIVTYFIGDTAKRHGMKLVGVADALVDNRPIVFVDDFIGTGSQLIDVMESYLGEARTNNLGEERRTLGPHADLLRSKKIAAVFAVGTTSGISRSQARLNELGMDATVYSHASESDIPTVTTIGLSDEVAARFIGALKDIASKALVNYEGTERTEEWIAGKLLGYGNLGFLLTSTFNTPTAALTALWAEKPGAWRPLLRRRRKE